MGPHPDQSKTKNLQNQVSEEQMLWQVTAIIHGATACHNAKPVPTPSFTTTRLKGKKINLSLSEMAQFFMKMAQAIKKKKLKPGLMWCQWRDGRVVKV